MKTTLTFLFTFLALELSIAQNLQTGLEHYKNESYEEAIKVFKAIKSNHKDYAEARFYLGRIAFDQQEYDDAKDYFKAAYKRNDQVSKYHTWYGNSIGTLAQSASKIRQGILAPKIKNAYKRAVELNPKDIDAQLGLMEFYSQAPGVMGGSWEKALQAAEAVYQIDPIQGMNARATVYQRKEDYAAAEKEYIKLSEKEDVYIYTLGMFYQRREQFDKAAEAFELAYSKDSENWAALYQIGRNCALSGLNPSRGLEVLNLYMNEDRGKNLPSHAAAKSRKAMIYEKQGDIGKARSLYEEALQMDPKMNLAQDGLKRVSKR